MYKVTVEDIEGKEEKRTIIIGKEYAIFGTDPNKEDIAFSSVNASPNFLMNLKESIIGIITKSITKKKCETCEKKENCDKQCIAHTIDLAASSPEMVKEMYELVMELKNMGHDPKEPIDLGKMSPQFKEKVINILKKVRADDDPLSKIAEMIMKGRDKNPFGGTNV